MPRYYGNTYKAGNGWAEVLILIFSIVFIVVVSKAASNYRCTAMTRNMGIAHDWSWFGGCVVEVEDGRWIPLDNYYFREE